MQQDKGGSRRTRLWHLGFGPEGVLSRSRGQLRELGGKLAALLEPAPVVKRGTQLAAHALFILVSGLLGLGLASPWGAAVDVLVGIIIGVLLLSLVNLIVSNLRAVLPYLPRYLTWGSITIILAFYVLLVLMVGLPPHVGLLLILTGVFVVGALGGAGAYLWTTRRSSRSRGKKWAASIVLLGSLLASAGMVLWLSSPGTDDHLLAFAAGTAPMLDAPDPSLPGPYPVAYLTYGSGRDRFRPEYGGQVGLKTASVDARPFLKSVPGWQASLRSLYWGFGFEALPLNARVWYPEGEGVFPLVLIVHGNHNMMHASDPGYAWLGEHLASRGFILASVDQNFLNGAPIIGNISPENDARGWLLLEHLKLWQAWSADDASPFFDKVDLNNIALIGHSRGGEAAVIAATFNDLPHYPDDASITFDYAFAIRGVVAIAPSDGQYRPADRFTPLTDVSYLVLQGGHDSDSHLFLGDRQYQRTTFSGDGDPFKASVYIYAANHGQFNTVWGRSDLPAPWSWLLNTQPLMSGTAQRQAGKVFITAFLEETLARRSSYRPLFHDHRSAAQWLPDTAYVTRFQDAGFHVVSNFEEDIDLTTTTAPGGRQAGENLALWREGDIRLRGGSLRNNHAVTLGWQAADGIEDTPAYTIELPEGLAAEWQLDDQSLLSFDLSASTESLPGSERENEAQPLDLTVELVDDAGRVVALPLSAFRPIAPPLPVRFTKLSMLDAAHFKQATEPLLQTYALPLASFVEQEPAFDLTRLAALRFRFDQTPTGIILLDEVGFAQAAQP